MFPLAPPSPPSLVPARERLSLNSVRPESVIVESAMRTPVTEAISSRKKGSSGWMNVVTRAARRMAEQPKTQKSSMLRHNGGE
ncbi:hypothetical protein Spico_1015 [Parasphaerochaeta coccoides DSM 17374]|uniref:Uncharacterized protein n=1 Tax=Parasphaerochaeta coccoides (strain ATCC BAA-1237 / DSM 17374 / SPN1) TaxID=760011 RepID=F4GJH2_PARC1|nr:hypothetical protein Spico_1015 [Parasphaerochaeta coccoides DSM 17374]